MSQALLRQYMPVSIDPVGDFVRNAPEELHIDELVTAFASAIAVHQGASHCFCAIDEDGSLIPLFGDDLTLADSGRADLIEIEAETIEGDALLLLVSARADIDRKSLSSLRMLATLYAAHGVALYEAADIEPVDTLITATEQQILSMTMAGWSHLDIGEHLQRSAPAVGVHLRRIASRLGVSSIAEATRIIVSRGMLSHFPVGGPA